MATPTAASNWWRDGVIYQIYPRSFADSNGDGDEVLTFGDVTSYPVTRKASFPVLPVLLKNGEALHLPRRDLRLRYVDREVVTDALPGLSSHGGYACPMLSRTAKC